MVAGHGDVGGAGDHQLQGAGDHARSGVERAGIAVASHLSEVLAEQLVGAVDEVDFHVSKLVGGEQRQPRSSLGSEQEQSLKSWARGSDSTYVATDNSPAVGQRTSKEALG